jgi:tubulin-specific chaperone A
MSSLRKAKEPISGNKKLQVQISVVKRMQKEVASYEKEVVQNEAKIAKMREDGRDEYDIKKQEEVLQESYMMIPDSKSRLESAIEALEACIVST